MSDTAPLWKLVEKWRAIDEKGELPTDRLVGYELCANELAAALEGWDKEIQKRGVSASRSEMGGYHKLGMEDEAWSTRKNVLGVPEKK